MIKSVIFDMDGTLLDTLEDIRTALNAALSVHNAPEVSSSDCRAFIGCGEKKRIELACSAGFTDAQKEAVRADYRAAYASALTKRTYAYEGINALLDGLDQRSIRYAIFSNKNQELAERLAAFYFSGRHFIRVIGSGSSYPLKPDPAAVFAIAESFGVSVSDIALIGDSVMDMEAASRAGAVGVGACWGYEKRDKLLKAGARYLAETPEEVTRFLG